MDIKENYGNIEAFISENGMGVANEERFMDETGQVIDDYRIEYIQDHLAYLWKAINDGCNIAKAIIYGPLLIAGHGSMPTKIVMV